MKKDNEIRLQELNKNIEEGQKELDKMPENGLVDRIAKAYLLAFITAWKREKEQLMEAELS